MRFSTPNVAIPSGDLFPNGVDISPANPDIQATVRPVGWMFRPSAGFSTVSPGKHQLDTGHPHGSGIHFTPLRFAEDMTKQFAAGGPPAMVDPVKAGDHVDINDIPGSEFLDGEGKLPAWMVAQNRGMYLTDGTDGAAPGAVPMHGGNTLRDMGDRTAFRPVTRAFYGLTQNPAGVLKKEWAESPIIAVAWGGALLGAIYLLGSNIEREFRGRRGRGVAASAGAAPAAAAAGTGASVADTGEAANKALTAAGDAVSTAVSAAGDAVEAAGDAVAKTTDAAADAVKD